MNQSSLRIIVTFVCVNDHLLQPQAVAEPICTATLLSNDEYTSYNHNSRNMIPLFYGNYLRHCTGICESGDFWYQIFKKHVVNDLSLSSRPTDQFLYHIKRIDNHGILETLADDTIASRDNRKEVRHEKQMCSVNKIYTLQKHTTSFFK